MTDRIYSPCEDGADDEGYVEVSSNRPVSDWLAARTFPRMSRQEWTEREIAKRRQEIEDEFK